MTVWRIPFSDERGCAGKTVRSLNYTLLLALGYDTRYQ